VFYELGLAHAIEKPVVLVAETMDDVPFDWQALTFRKDLKVRAFPKSTDALVDWVKEIER
jgi:hypothetical protein